MDTIFCAAHVRTMHGGRTIVLPMLRLDTALYRVRLVLPDSTYHVRLEICIPTERLPNGIMEFAYQSDALPLLPNTAMDILDNVDSALAFERTMYPWNFYAYYQYWQKAGALFVQQHGGISREQATAKVDSLLQIVMSQRVPTFNWYLTVSRFHSDHKNGDSLEHIYLDSAVQAQVRNQAYEPLLEDQGLWGPFFAPELRGEEFITQTARSRITLDLAAAYPRTELGKTWILSTWDIENFGQIENLDTAKVGVIINAWSTSNDVEILKAIAEKLLIKDALFYNPVRAEHHLRRAEHASLQQLGFRSGENIYGSRGRVDRMRALLVSAYSAQGRHDVAIAFGNEAMQKAQNGYGRQLISQALVHAARASGDTALAETFKNYVLPAIPDFAFETIDGSRGRLADYAGKVIVIDLWFIGCSGCFIEHKSLNEFGTKYKDDSRVVFLSIALNDKTALKKYLARFPLEATVIPDAQEICNRLGVNSYPTHVIIDQTGKTVLWQVGGSERSGEELGTKVDALLK